ncbi:hypothetical protein H1C71_018912, partial [Ictidomys tridecemlineatus]
MRTRLWIHVKSLRSVRFPDPCDRDEEGRKLKGAEDLSKLQGRAQSLEVKITAEGGTLEVQSSRWSALQFHCQAHQPSTRPLSTWAACFNKAPNKLNLGPGFPGWLLRGVSGFPRERLSSARRYAKTSTCIMSLTLR